MFKSWHPLLVATKLAPQTTHRLVFGFAIFLPRRTLSSVVLEHFSYCHSDPAVAGEESQINIGTDPPHGN